MIKNAFYQKAKINFKVYDVTDWEANNHNAHTYCPISQKVKVTRQ